MEISFKVAAEETRGFLHRLAAALGDTTPANRIIGEYVRGSVLKNFEAQGRPEPWTPLADATLWGRVRGKKFTKRGGLTKNAERRISGARILMRTGRLRKSIGYLAGKDKVTIGTNLIYSAIQQFGGMAGRGHQVEIPARPYLMLQDEDQPAIEKILGDWLLGRPPG